MGARDKLNARQRLFVREYVWGQRCGNGAEAARLAGYKDAEASHAGYQLLRKPHLKAAVDKELAEKRELVKQKALSSVERQLAISVARPTDILDADGNLRPFAQWTESAKAAIAAIEVEDLYEWSGNERSHIGVIRKIKFHDPTPASRVSLQWAGELKDKVEVTGGVTLEQLVPKNKPQSTEGSK